MTTPPAARATEIIKIKYRRFCNIL